MNKETPITNQILAAEQRGRDMAVDYIEAECQFVKQDVHDGNDGYFIAMNGDLESARLPNNK